MRKGVKKMLVGIVTVKQFTNIYYDFIILFDICLYNNKSKQSSE